MSVSVHRDSFLPVEPIDIGIATHGRSSGEMIIALELRFNDLLEASLLARALQLLLESEPILHSRLVLTTATPRWEPVPESTRRALVFTTARQTYERMRCAGLDATENVPLAVCLWRRDRGDQLLIQMVHEAGDGVALQRLSERLASIYRHVCNDRHYRPPPV